MKINLGKIRTFMTWLTNLLLKGREVGLWNRGQSIPTDKANPLKLK